MKKHRDGKENERYWGTVPGCNKRYPTSASRSRHVTNHKRALEGVMHTCDECEKNFSTQAALNRHSCKPEKYKIVEKDGRFLCPVESCSSSFTTKGYAKKHVKDRHERKREAVECPPPQLVSRHQMCSIEAPLTRSSFLARSPLAPTSLQSFSGKVLKSEMLLSRHMVVHTERQRIPCPKAGRWVLFPHAASRH
ncbi:hypothetical protein BDZ90DRAFT_106742 [Jaminaea rosea]|uniref:C2H2-type domain-containing protein n=1 Tax=Jaminaea rosea TaxID=1569628 RepID=A0A316V1R8_9BASI|nr:hypothetical protein BDZ90DRAFT_106742 [Jaminaea rosea]PWN29365.1 hypothetical protein BDZ90DRAFT_106742 [Jaminaea rosea]